MMSSLAFTVNIPLGKQPLRSTKGNKDVFANWWDKYFRGIISARASGTQEIIFSKIIQRKKKHSPLSWQVHTCNKIRVKHKRTLMTLGKSEESFCPGKVDWGTWRGRCVGTSWAGYPRIQLYPEFWPATMRNILYNSFSPLTVGSSWVIQQRRGKQNRKKTRSTWYIAKLIWDSPCTNQIWRWPTTLYRKAIFEQELSYQKLKKLNFQI